MKLFRPLAVFFALLVFAVVPADAGKLVNRAMMTVSGTPGTGTITLGGAVSGFQTFAAAGVANGDVISYIIEDGTSWEYGQGTYTSAGTTLARTTVQGSSAGGTTAISATANARVFASALAADIVTPTTGITAGQMPALTGTCVTTVGTIVTACIQDGGVTTYTPSITHGGTAPTAENSSGSYYKKIGSNLYLVTISYTITTLGSPTGNVSFPLPLSLTAAVGSACAVVNSTGPATAGSAETVLGNTSIFFQPSPYAATTYFVTCMVGVT